LFSSKYSNIILKLKQLKLNLDNVIKEALFQNAGWCACASKFPFWKRKNAPFSAASSFMIC
jgi:hypothetical protein